MKRKHTGAILSILGIVALVYALLFALYHTSNNVAHAAVQYASIFLTDFVAYTVPIFVAVSLAVITSHKSIGASLLWAIPFSLVKMIYTVPHLYLEAMKTVFDTADALILSFFKAIFDVVITYVEISVFLLIIILVTQKIAKRKKLPIGYLDSSMKNAVAFDLSDSQNLSILICALSMFVYSLTVEIIETIRFLREYFYTYNYSEILYIALRYVFILLTLLLTQIIAVKLKAKLHSRLEEEK